MTRIFYKHCSWDVANTFWHFAELSLYSHLTGLLLKIEFFTMSCFSTKKGKKNDLKIRFKGYFTIIRPSYCAPTHDFEHILQHMILNMIDILLHVLHVVFSSLK